MSIAATIKILTCLESVVLGTITLRQNSKNLSNILFAVYLFFIAAQTFVEFNLIVAPNLNVFLSWKRWDGFSFGAVACLFHLSLVYANVPIGRNRRVVSLIYVLFLGITLADATLAQPVSGEPVSWGFESVHSATSGLVFTTNLIIACLFAIGSLLLFFRTYHRSQEHRERMQSRIMFFAMGALIVSGVLLEIADPLFGYSFPWAFSATTAFLIVNPFMTYAMIRYDLLAITPTTAADEILETMSDGVLLLDGRGAIRFANRAVGRMLGVSTATLPGRSVDTLPIKTIPVNGDASLNGSFWVKETLVDKEGVIDRNSHGYLPISLSSSPLIRKENTYGFIVTVRDISIRKQAEERREAVEKILRHDLKNSLGAILGFSEILGMDDSLSGEHRKWADAIYRSGEMMLRQIESYLALERMEQGTFRFAPVPMDLLECLRELSMSLSGKAKSFDVGIVLRHCGAPVRGNDSCGIISERPLVFSMLNNLLKNAIEASPSGAEVFIDVEKTGEEYITVSIKNEGEITDAVKRRFFDKFVSHGKHDGTGLGTYSAKLIAETIGGKIALSTALKGIVVVGVTLPISPQRCSPLPP